MLPLIFFQGVSIREPGFLCSSLNRPLSGSLSWRLACADLTVSTISALSANCMWLNPFEARTLALAFAMLSFPAAKVYRGVPNTGRTISWFNRFRMPPSARLAHRIRHVSHWNGFAMSPDRRRPFHLREVDVFRYRRFNLMEVVGLELRDAHAVSGPARLHSR